jgi:uncharacterized membrane protein YphA (DoxX/SURF4 family)
MNPVTSFPLLGRVLLACGLAALGFENLIRLDMVMELQPLPQWMPARQLFAAVTALVLIGGSALLLLGVRLRLVAGGLAGFLLWWLVFLHLPRVVAHFDKGAAWTPALEILALFGALLVVAAAEPAEKALPLRWNSTLDRLAPVGRALFAVTLPGFGVLHFIYHDYVASVIPAWIPYPLFWAYATGVAHAAAGVALLTGVLNRLAVTLLGIMFGTWVVILHVPRATADVANWKEWTSLFVATALCGGAFVVAGSLAREHAARSSPDAARTTAHRQTSTAGVGR